MPFDLKNVGANYHRLMDSIFALPIRQKLEVYTNDMIVKTIEGNNHAKDLEDVLQPVRKYDMHINPAKCSFGVKTRNFWCSF